MKDMWILTKGCRKSDGNWYEIFTTEKLAQAAFNALPECGEDKYVIDQDNSHVSKATFVA
jgi:hypothetical protein